jgi:hypothetical protein
LSTIGNSTKPLSTINFIALELSIIGECGNLTGSAAYACVGSLYYAKIGINATGLLTGGYATTPTINGEQCQGLEISDHSYGCIIGNGVSGIRIAFKSKYNIIGQNVTNVKIGSYTNNTIIPKKTTNWDIGDGIEMTGKTLPTIVNDAYYAKTVRKANTAVVVKYDDETGATITTII